MAAKNPRSISDLREALFDAIDGVRSGDLDVEKAKQIGELAQVIVNSAKVEVDYLRANDGGETPFLESTGTGNLPDGITGRTVHRLKG